MTARVIHVVGHLGVGGAERMILNATRNMPTNSVVFDFLVFGDEVGELEEEFLKAHARVLRMPAPKTVGPLRFIVALRRLLREQGEVQAVHSHVNLASSWIVVAAWAAGVKHRVVHSHNTSYPELGIQRMAYSALSRVLVRRFATRYVACGQRAGENMFGRAWRKRGTVVPNAVNPRDFESQKLRPVASPSTSRNLIMIARLVPFKNHEFALQVLAASATEHPDWRMTIVGEGPERGRLQNIVSQLRLAGRVEFLGNRSDVPALMGSADLLLAPSLYEGLPLNLIEAQASGLPILTSDKVTEEVDLGLNLVTFLGLDSVEAWIRAIEYVRQPILDREQIEDAFRGKGYDVRFSSQVFLPLYGVNSAD